MKKKIIYLDDINYNLVTINTRLKQHYDIYPAQSVAMMYDILADVIPDLILLDINMPGESGFDVLKRLKNDNDLFFVPVIFLTSRTDKETLLQGMKMGAADYLIKSYSNEKMIDHIEMHLTPDKPDKPIILAVDDNPSILKSVNYTLNDRYTVRVLNDSEKISDILSIVIPDLFLLDCNMPVVSGLDLIPVIRALPAYENTPIMFLSAEGTLQNVAAARKLGAEDFVIKPIDAKVLREKVAAQLSNYLFIRHLRDFGKE